jgi:hypothetical protein
MVVVAGAALVCGTIAELPASAFLLVLLVPAIGPLIGAGWAGRRYQPGSLDPISGGLVGGTAQATLMAMVLSVVSTFQPPFLAIPLLAVEFFYGLIVGSIITYGLLIVASEPSSPRTIPGGKRVGTSLREREPARAVDEMEAWSELFHEAGPHEPGRPTAAGQETVHA